MSAESIRWLRLNQRLIVPLLGCSTALLVGSDWSARPRLSFFLLLLFFASAAHAGWRLWSSFVPRSVLIGLALALRLLALPLAPDLSNDVYRYIWDGRVAAGGFNPYFHRPDSDALVPFRDELWERMDHRQVETVYPPLAILFFSIASLFSQPVLAWKLILVFLDLGSCVLLLRLAQQRGLASGRTVGYLWNPLDVVEVAGMGHVDALGVFTLLLAASLLLRNKRHRATVSAQPPLRIVAAAAALALATLAKLLPVLLVPLWARLSGRRTIFLATVAVIVGAALLPFVWTAAGLPPGLVTYGVSWEFNGPVFEPLWRLLDSVRAADAVKSGLALVERWSGRPKALADVYRWVYPQLLAKLVLALVLVLAVVASGRRRSLVAGTLFVLGSLLLASATVYPWYLLWLLPWATLEGRVSWLALSVTIVISYLPQLLGVALFPWLFILIWAPFLAVAVFEYVRPPDPLLPR